MSNPKEETIAQAISYYMQLEHKDIIFRFDYGADVKQSIGQAKKMKQLQGVNSRGFPDLTIYEPINEFHGLLIEMKAITPFKKDGTLKKSEHLKEQQEYHERLRAKGYYVTFATGYDEIKSVIVNYLEGNLI